LELSSEDGIVRTVHRALLLLDSMAEVEGEISIRDLSRRVGLPRSTVQRLLASLEAEGMVHQHSNRASYRLGAGIYQFVAKVHNRLDLRLRALPVMKHARDLSKQTVTLSIREGDYATVIDSVEGTGPLRGAFHPGDRIPLYVGAAGKLILSSLSEEEADSRLASMDLEPLTKNTICDPAKLKTELELIRRQGYSTSDGERYIGLFAVAAPVRDYTGSVIAAVFLNGPRQEFVGSQLAAKIGIVREAAEEISERMGFDLDPSGVTESQNQVE
jgi:DNA-binding IclR family transcriptional regulator